MALDVDLSVEELSDTAVLYLSEMLAPVDTFSVLSPEDSRVKSTGTSGGVYQVEVTGTIPSAADNVANYETGLTSGTNANVAVTTASISVLQTLTNLEQQQGIPFVTKVDGAAKGLANAVWDKCTAMMNGAGYTDAGAITAGALTAANLTDLRQSVDSLDVTLLLEHVEAGPIYPTDKNSFQLTESGAYGFNRIFPVSNFTGGVANQVALAASKSAAVAIAGAPLRDGTAAQLVGQSSLLENFTVESIGIPVEMRVWQNTATQDLHMTLEVIFGISVAQAAAGAFLDHA